MINPGERLNFPSIYYTHHGTRYREWKKLSDNCELVTGGLLIASDLCSWQINQIIHSTHLIIIEAPEDLFSFILAHSIHQESEVDSVRLAQARPHFLTAL